MMFLKEADDLLTPFFKKPQYNIFEEKTPRIKELKNKIQEKMKVMDESGKLFHPLGLECVELDEDTEKMFREFADICKVGLRDQ